MYITFSYYYYHLLFNLFSFLSPLNHSSNIRPPSLCPLLPYTVVLLSFTMLYFACFPASFFALLSSAFFSCSLSAQLYLAPPNPLLLSLVFSCLLALYSCLSCLLGVLTHPRHGGVHRDTLGVKRPIRIRC